MKTLIFILLLLPVITMAQLTPDSLLGCYAGIYMHYEEPDTSWTTVYQDTMIVFNIDTSYVDYNDTTYEVIELGWLLKKTDYRFDNGYNSFCTIGFDFKQCPYQLEDMISSMCNSRKDFLFFSQNDSVFFMHECWAKSQFEPQLQYIRFLGKKYSSQVPDSLFNIEVEEIKENELFAKIYPNPTTNIINIELNKIEKTKIELININGEKIFLKEFSSSNYILNMLPFEKGVYVIKLSNSTNILTTKIILL